MDLDSSSDDEPVVENHQFLSSKSRVYRHVSPSKQALNESEGGCELTHSLTHSFIHGITHSLTHWLMAHYTFQISYRLNVL